MPLPWKRNPSANLSPEEAKRSHTEKIAYELSQTRQLLKRPGDPTTDWETAEKIVKNPVRKALYRCHRPFIRLEKNTWEPLLTWANNQALLSLLGMVGNIGLIIAVATYIGSEKHRRNAEVLNAWQTITNAHGQAGNGGRIQALEFLNASPGANWRRKFPWFCAPSRFCLWEAESLDGIDLSVDGSNLVFLNIPSEFDSLFSMPSELNEDAKVVGRDSRVYLRNIQLSEANLIDANLLGADLRGANLLGADLERANLSGADLEGANLSGADLERANLSGADLEDANLSEAYLGRANLSEADLWDANLSEAYLGRANLSEADLGIANLSGAYLWGANLETVKISTLIQHITLQLSQAKLCNPKLPSNIDLPLNRDCNEVTLFSRPRKRKQQ